MPNSAFTVAPTGPLNRIFAKYLVAIAVVSIGALLRYLLHPYLEHASFAVTLLSVLIAAWVGGLPATLLVQTLVLLLEGFFFGREPSEPPTWSRAAIGIGVFYAVGITVALLSEFTTAARKQALHEAENADAERERLLATLTCAADGIVVIDAHGEVRMVNPVAVAMTGATEDALLGSPIGRAIQIVDDQKRPVVFTTKDVLARGGILQNDQPLFLVSQTGAQAPVSVSAAAIKDKNRTVTGTVILLHDETERHRVEQDLRQADRRKDEFLATLAHELRNPLAPIRTGLDLLKLSQNDPTLFAETIARMERQTDHMVRLIDDLLDVSRITRGKLQLHCETVKVEGILKDAIEATESLINNKQHRLRVSTPETPVWWNVDPHRMTQVITNLLNNAARFTPPGGQINLIVEPSDEQVVIRVKDTGVGIPQEMQARIFDLFAQVHKSLEHGGSGLGIGLTLVKSLVELHGGKVDIVSDGEGAGSEFVVCVPRVIPAVNFAEEVPDSIISPSPQCHRVLVVDDNSDAAETLARLVKALGHTAVIAFDGSEALLKAADFKPQIILMDLGMPELNGFEAAREIRRKAWGVEVLLVAVTGWGKDEDKRRSREAGFDEHLVKPIELSALQSVLASVGAKAELACV